VSSVVDVIVPVYGAAGDLGRCLESVVAETDLARHGLLLVLDGPQDDEVEAIVRSVSAARVLRNEARRGFVESVNHGMRVSTRDVVLLNSDTIVTPRWLEKLLEAAASVDPSSLSSRTGTVTPLSNHATLCSVPRAFEENLLPSGYDVRSFSLLVERVSARTYPRIPTAVGVCMFIRRALLDEIGFFDAEHFGFGYGEENDFCMRAAARGWTHIADDATFIQHAGHRSFRGERAALQRKARRTLARLHPGYMPAIARFMAEDPLAPARARIVSALREKVRAPAIHNRAPRRVVHVVHGWPPFATAGTELYARWLVQEQVQWREVSVFSRIDDPSRAQGAAVEWVDEGARVRLVTNHFVQRNPLARNAIADRMLERDFARFLREERPALVHVHHLAGHSFSLTGVARRFGIPIVQQVQDWWPLCARVNLFDAWGQRCSGPGLDKCARCAPLTGIAPAFLWNRALHLTRRFVARRSLAAADAYVMGSEFIRRDYERAGLFAKNKPVFVLPYGVGMQPRSAERPPAARPLRFGFVGSALPHKGLHIVTAAFRDLDPSLATLQVWGSAGTPFAEADKAAVYASMDVLIFPSVGLESFGLVAREAMVCGVPVIATRDGALTEMDAEFFPSGDAEALRAIVLRLAADPRLVDAWARRLPPVKSAAAHAEEIEDVYGRVLAGHR
jgi:GT2 family glycosyltransferase/glycosyltransferase involved in cell wall biosynthesis